MYSQSKSGLGRLVAVLPAMIIFACAFATFAAAQDRPVPKWEIYGGYSVFDPAADVHGQRPAALLPLSSRLETNPKGVGLSGTYNFNRWLGLTIDGSNHWGSGETTFATRIDDTRFDNISLGPKFTFRSRHLSPFLEALAGDHRLVPEAFHSVDKLGFMAGGGQSKNVFWQIGSSATLGTNTTFSGNIMALASITVNTGATLNGRALARNGAVTLDTNQVNVPTCP